MMLPRPAADRSANVLVIVAVLSFLMLMALASLGFLTRTDVSTNSNMLRESLATNMAESIAAQIEAQVNCNPWSKRFWFVEAQAAGAVGADDVPTLTLNRATAYVNLSKDALPASDYDFVGVVKDLPGELRQYRLYVEVTVKGEPYAFSWDKQWEQSLLAGMNRDSTLVDKPLEMGSGGTAPTDDLIDKIKKQATLAAPPEGVDPAQTARVTQLRADEPAFATTTLPPDPTRAPFVPQQPRGK